jgi:hypothetical protein
MQKAITKALAKYAYRFKDEKQLHDGIAIALSSAGIVYEREYISGADRFDFMCAIGSVIEAKIKGSLSEALRQAERYCRNPEVKSVLIVTTKATHSYFSEDCAFNGKPVRLLKLRGQSF